MKKLLFASLLTALAVSSEASEPGQRAQMPIDALVADEVTATRIAEAILAPIYGENILVEQQPLIANLVGDVWQINGTILPHSFGRRIHIEISKRDGRVLQVTLGRHHDSAM